MRFKKAILAGCIMAGFLMSYPATAKAQDMQKVKFTCYCPESCPGTVTASGAKVREGIIASNREHLGDGAMIYLTDGTFLGYYECLDIGGTDGIRNGYVIDAYMDSLKRAKDMMALTEGEVMIRWIEKPKG